MNSKVIFLALALCLSVAGAVKVTNMPWWPADYPSKFDFYSDYLQTSSPNRTIHYAFLNQTAQSGASERPLVLWLNGGPGCSSLLGLLQEIGPFVMDDLEGNFTLFNNSAYNPHTWLNDADLLFFETPPGVGFSENNDTNYTYTDNNTASDSYSGLIHFFTQFPELLSRKFFIAGESYAGMYVPYLALEITNRNALNTTSLKVNLQGILVGNGVAITSPDSVLNDDTNRFLSYHKVISPQLDNILYNVCPADPNSASCVDAMNQIQQLTTFVNPYDIFRYCNYLNHPFEPKYAEELLKNSAPRAAFKFGARKENLVNSVVEEINMLKNRLLAGENSTSNSSSSSNASGPVLKDGGPISCQNSPQVINYLNVAEVKKALNVNTNIRWSDCNNTLFPIYQRDPRGSQWIYGQLRGQIKITVFSGDTDSVVPWTHTERWIKNLNIQVKEAWRPWYASNQQIGGYVTVYDGIDFVTVRGAGHMVPQWRREEARLLFRSFINGTKL